MARILLVHDDPEFLAALAASLREKGHRVAAFDELVIPVDRPRVSDILEVAIVQTKGENPGIRLRVIGQPKGMRYSATMDRFLADPVTALDVKRALRKFVPPSGKA